LIVMTARSSPSATSTGRDAGQPDDVELDGEDRHRDARRHRDREGATASIDDRADKYVPAPRHALRRDPDPAPAHDVVGREVRR
jgi:hypothetical protein